MLPSPLKSFDIVCVISPSGAIDGLYIDGATQVLSAWGLSVIEGKHSRGNFGRFSGTIEQRVYDIQSAIDDPKVKAILCSRGGYGLAQIVDKIDFGKFIENPKWLIGFSDITVLHSAISNFGIASIHGPMAKQLSELSLNSPQISNLKNILFGELPSYSTESNKHNKIGSCSGKLIGGNLSVLYGLRATKFDLETRNNILLIEDISEKPYHIDRMMQNLRLSGVLSSLNGLIVGQFTDCEEDILMMQTIQEIILSAVNEFNYPVCFNFPSGHFDNNLPLIFGENVNLNVTSDKVTLNFK